MSYCPIPHYHFLSKIRIIVDYTSLALLVSLSFPIHFRLNAWSCKVYSERETVYFWQQSGIYWKIHCLSHCLLSILRKSISGAIDQRLNFRRWQLQVRKHPRNSLAFSPARMPRLSEKNKSPGIVVYICTRNLWIRRFLLPVNLIFFEAANRRFVAAIETSIFRWILEYEGLINEMTVTSPNNG